MRAACPSLESAASDIRLRMAQQAISPRTLLGRMSLIDDLSRQTGQFQDPNHLPFYFHAGRVLNPRRILCFGLEIGLQVSCLLQGCSDPELAFCVQFPTKNFYSPRVAVSNIKTVAGRRFAVGVHVGRMDEDSFPRLPGSHFDMAVVTVPIPPDSLMDSMDSCWAALAESGHIVIDRLSEPRSEEVFRDFCRAKGAEFVVFETRYKVGIARK